MVANIGSCRWDFVKITEAFIPIEIRFRTIPQINILVQIYQQVEKGVYDVQQ